jgi:hypothetical protein
MLESWLAAEPNMVKIIGSRGVLGHKIHRLLTLAFFLL